MKIRPVVVESLRANGRTDTHDNADSRFEHYCERAYICVFESWTKLVRINEKN
jgi:hypothetical protein